LNDRLAELIAAIVLDNRWPGCEAWIAKWRQWPPSLLRPAFNALLGRDGISDRLGEITAPALVIHGTSDAAIDIELAQDLSSKLANCRPLVRIQGAGHACNLTHPELVNLAALEHLAVFGIGTPPRVERRGDSRRTERTRRSGERRLLPLDRRMAERRGRERRESWPSPV
jgi:hypothetical protein